MKKNGLVLLLSLLIVCALLIVFFQGPKKVSHATKGDINTIIGGILESEVPPDENLFSETISNLVEGRKKEYLELLSQLNSTVKPKKVSDVIIKGKREYSWPYRGIYLFDVRDMRYALAHVDKIKAAGIDSLMLQVNFQADKKTEKAYVAEEEIYLFYINAFQKSGFRVLLIPALELYFCSRRELNMPTIQNKTTKLDELEPHIFRWAEIAEKYNVDTFMPSDEAQRLFIEEGETPDHCMVYGRVLGLVMQKRHIFSRWMQELLPRIREKFFGNVGFATDDNGPCELMGIPTQNPQIGPDFNYSGYDYVVYKEAFPSILSSDEHWEMHTFNWSFPFIANFSARDKVKGIIVYEAGDTVGTALQEDFAGMPSVRNTNELHQRESYEKFFELTKEYPQISLFFKISAIQPHEPDWNPFGKPAEEILEENYANVYGTLPLTEFDKLWIAIGEDGLKAIQICMLDGTPFDSDYRNYRGAYRDFASKVRPLCR